MDGYLFAVICLVLVCLVGCLLTSLYMMYRQSFLNKDTDLYLLEVDYISGKVKLKPYVDKGRYEKW